MRKIITICIIGLFALNVQAQPVKTLKLSDKELLDKIKGGWAGQTIGVVFGAPTEFKFTGPRMAHGYLMSGMYLTKVCRRLVFA